MGTLFFLFWIAKDFDTTARSWSRKSGGRFERKFVVKQDGQAKIEAWSKKFGYVLKSAPNEKPVILAKKSYPMYPIFVSFEILDEGFQKIEGWVSTHNRDYPFKSGFQLLGAIRIGAKELSQLLRDLGEPPIE